MEREDEATLAAFYDDRETIEQEYSQQSFIKEVRDYHGRI